MDDISVIANSIEGWLSEAQGRALYRAAAATAGRGLIVEIGSWKGRSTVWLASGAKAVGRTIIAVDPHERSRENPEARTLDAFLDNLRRANVIDAVKPLIMRSDQAIHTVDGGVELLFIDGDHSFDGSRTDVDLWVPRLVDGGTVMFHDVATSGYAAPRRMFQRHICWNSAFHRIRRIGSLAIAERTGQRSRMAAIRVTIFGILLYRYDLQGALKRALRSVRRALGVSPPARAST